MWSVTEKPKYREYSRDMRRGRNCWAPATVLLCGLMVYALWIQNEQYQKIAEAEIHEEKLASQLADLKSERLKQNDALNRLQSQVNEKQAEIVNLEGQKDNFKMKLEESQKMFETMKQRNIDEQLQLAKKDTEIVNAEESKKTLLQEIAAYKEGNQEKEVEVSRLNDEITALKEAYQKIKASYTKIKAANASQTVDSMAKEEPNPQPEEGQIEPDATTDEPSKIEAESTQEAEQANDDEENEIDAQSIEEEIIPEATEELGAESEIDTDDVDYKNQDTDSYENKAQEENEESY